MTFEDIEKSLTEQKGLVDTLTKKVDELTADNVLLKSENETVLKMSKKERKLFGNMSAEDKKKFLAGDAEKRKAMMAECEKAKSDDEEEPDEDDLEKKKKLEKVEKSIEAKIKTEYEERFTKAEKELADIRKAERVAKFVRIAETTLPNTAGKPEEKADVLMKMADTFGEDSAAYKNYLDTLKAADDHIAKAMKEIGSVGGGPAPAIKVLEGKAEEIMKRDDGKSLSRQQAFNKAVVENPDLYDQYLKERPTQTA